MVDHFRFHSLCNGYIMCMQQLCKIRWWKLYVHVVYKLDSIFYTLKSVMYDCYKLQHVSVAA